MKRPGYYVDHKEWFGDRFHQARARAAYLAQEHGRPIDLTRHEHEAPDDAQPQLILTVLNGKKKAA